MMEKLIEQIEAVVPVVLLLATVAGMVLRKLQMESPAKHADLFADTLTEVLQAVKVAKGLSGADVQALRAEAVKAALPAVSKLADPSIVAKTIESIEGAYKAKDLAAAAAAPTLSIEGNVTGKEIGAAVRAELRRAVLEVQGSGVPGKGIDGAKIAARVGIRLGKAR